MGRGESRGSMARDGKSTSHGRHGNNNSLNSSVSGKGESQSSSKSETADFMTVSFDKVDTVYVNENVHRLRIATASGEQQQVSSKLTDFYSPKHQCNKINSFDTIVKYGWKPETLQSTSLMDTFTLHKDETHHQFLAYTLDGNDSSGSIRILELKTRSRLLLEHTRMKCSIQDLSFSKSISRVILGCIDSSGSVFIFEVLEKGGEEGDVEIFSSRVLFVLSSKLDFDKVFHSFVWCPFAYVCFADESREHQSSDLLFAVIKGKVVEWFDLCGLLEATVSTHSKLTMDQYIHYRDNLNAEKYAPFYRVMFNGDLQDKTRMLGTKRAWATDVVISPDSKAMAIAFSNGKVAFYECSNGASNKLLRTWSPHDGRPVSFMAFLDDLRMLQDGDDSFRSGCSSTDNFAFWRFALTGCEMNSELKLWSCNEWRCLQTIRLLSYTKNQTGSVMNLALDRSRKLILAASSTHYAGFFLFFKLRTSPLNGQLSLAFVSSFELSTKNGFIRDLSILEVIENDGRDEDNSSDHTNISIQVLLATSNSIFKADITHVSSEKASPPDRGISATSPSLILNSIKKEIIFDHQIIEGSPTSSSKTDPQQGSGDFLKKQNLFSPNLTSVKLEQQQLLLKKSPATQSNNSFSPFRVKTETSQKTAAAKFESPIRNNIFDESSLIITTPPPPLPAARRDILRETSSRSLETPNNDTSNRNASISILHEIFPSSSSKKMKNVDALGVTAVKNEGDSRVVKVKSEPHHDSPPKTGQPSIDLINFISEDVERTASNSYIGGVKCKVQPTAAVQATKVLASSTSDTTGTSGSSSSDDFETINGAETTSPLHSANMLEVMHLLKEQKSQITNLQNQVSTLQRNEVSHQKCLDSTLSQILKEISNDRLSKNLSHQQSAHPESRLISEAQLKGLVIGEINKSVQAQLSKEKLTSVVRDVVVKDVIPPLSNSVSGMFSQINGTFKSGLKEIKAHIINSVLKK